MVVGIAGASRVRTTSKISMKNLIINILEEAAFLLLGLGVSLLG